MILAKAILEDPDSTSDLPEYVSGRQEPAKMRLLDDDGNETEFVLRAKSASARAHRPSKEGLQLGSSAARCQGSPVDHIDAAIVVVEPVGLRLDWLLDEVVADEPGRAPELAFHALYRAGH